MNHLLLNAIVLIVSFTLLQSTCFAEEMQSNKKNKVTTEKSMPMLSNSLETTNLDTSNMKAISLTRYITGGVVGTLFGFGIGHAVQGRWLERGWIFTASKFVITAGLLGTIAIAVNNAAKSDSLKISSSIIGTIDVTSLLLAGVYIWEIVDVWTPPKSKYKIVSENQWGLTPLVSYNKHASNFDYGLSLSYTW